MAKMTYQEALKKAVDFLGPKRLNKTLVNSLNKSRGSLRRAQGQALSMNGKQAGISERFLKDNVFRYKKAEISRGGTGAFQKSESMGKDEGNVSITRFNYTYKKIPIKRRRSTAKNRRGGPRRKTRKQQNFVITSVTFPNGKTKRIGTNKKNYYYLMRKGLGRSKRKWLAYRRKDGNKSKPNYIGNFPLANYLALDKKTIEFTAEKYRVQFFKNFQNRLEYDLYRSRSRLLVRLLIRDVKF